MKKVWLLSAVAMGLAACGGSQDLAMSDPAPAIIINGGRYVNDGTGQLQGHTHGNYATDVQAAGSDARDGYVKMQHVTYGVETNTSGIVTPKFDGTAVVSPQTAGIVHYRGQIVHAGEGNYQVYGKTNNPYDVSAGAIDLTMDFSNKKFEGKAIDAPVFVTGIIPIVNDEGKVTGSTELTTIRVADRSYILNGDITKDGYSGNATMVEHEYMNITKGETSGAFSSTRNVSPNITMNGNVTGHFYGPNAEETAGKIDFIGNSQYNAAFGAQRTH
ncbi:MAG: transferrin-binding protein-like solute binding protein [Cardiobacteriaceae bacterium]|nr:transferrin-binding protein-like solute binding protein [Cardiobacteriaceae bacterium]